MIKKFNEIFDDEELKSQFEIPYLKGEISSDSMRWKKVSNPNRIETADTFHKKLLFRFPILNHFNSEVIALPAGCNAYCDYATSMNPVEDGNSYYGQLSSTYDNNDDVYHIDIILRNVNDYNNMNKWLRYSHALTDINDVYHLTLAFLTSCSKLNIISPKQKYSLQSN